jgi:hypothetical protein
MELRSTRGADAAAVSDGEGGFGDSEESCRLLRRGGRGLGLGCGSDDGGGGTGRCGWVRNGMGALLYVRGLVLTRRYHGVAVSLGNLAVRCHLGETAVGSVPYFFAPESSHREIMGPRSS